LRKDFEQGAFACSIAADDADDLALLNLEGDIAQGPECGIARGGGGIAERQPIPGRGGGFADRIAQRAVAFALAEAVFFAQIFDADNGVIHELHRHINATAVLMPLHIPSTLLQPKLTTDLARDRT